MGLAIIMGHFEGKHWNLSAAVPILRFAKSVISRIEANETVSFLRNTFVLFQEEQCATDR
jgi:hypothetical protein